MRGRLKNKDWLAAHPRLHKMHPHSSNTFLSILERDQEVRSLSEIRDRHEDVLV